MCTPSLRSQSRQPLRHIQTEYSVPFDVPGSSRQPHAAQSTSNGASTNHYSSSAIPPLDPSPHDPTATFIRWPFQQPIKWSTFANHPDWFLDPNDFNYEGAPLYPVELEPPRGWGPPKAKRGTTTADLEKEKNENRLRCTFCRRTYAGVNAKSMWRRHVYDKHHVAMRNRRDMTERPKSKSKPKENDVPTIDVSQMPSIGSTTAAKQKRPPTIFSKETTAGPLSTEEESKSISPTMNTTPPPAPRIPQREFTSSSHSVVESNLTDRLQSPYDPMRTPQFIHTRPREPLESALRFPNTCQTLCGPALSPLEVFASKTGSLSASFPPASSSPLPEFISDDHAMPWVLVTETLDLRALEDSTLSKLALGRLDELAGREALALSSSQISASTSSSSADLGGTDIDPPSFEQLLVQYIDLEESLDCTGHRAAHDEAIDFNCNTKPLGYSDLLGLGFMLDNPEGSITSR